ncbi:MAG: M23 family metallopeptidase [Desulfobacterales bacterium]|jgi:murein DD-endopeptidase MepM/ murein hydrolase activator NlpD|nr:M23 family metallopeptidase [Desulfobacteraceae bacterium]MBT7085987.1 M23 family metallopeptidase [Desulfobacterales bacterium]MBT7698387.1 M23 family metallopeptidase [Desulfobacterales bacterium]
MRNKITFFMFDSSNFKNRQITVSKLSLILLSAFITVAFFSFGFLTFNYLKLKKINSSTLVLERTIQNQLEDISTQKKQIHKFAGEINSFKTKLFELNGFEKKIRIIANIEDSDTNEGLFGVGGTIPDDLNPGLMLQNKNNNLIREMHEQVEELEYASIKQKGGLENLLKHLEDQKNLLASTPSIRPTKGRVTSRFGTRLSTFTNKREFHKGIDYSGRIGTPVIATADGIVTVAGSKGTLGKLITIDHGHGMVTRYAHLSKILKKRHELVKRGDVIALIGNTGRSTGPHLHYEVHLNGIKINPRKYILN